MIQTSRFRPRVSQFKEMRLAQANPTPTNQNLFNRSAAAERGVGRDLNDRGLELGRPQTSTLGSERSGINGSGYDRSRSPFAMPNTGRNDSGFNDDYPDDDAVRRRNDRLDDANDGYDLDGQRNRSRLNQSGDPYVNDYLDRDTRGSRYSDTDPLEDNYRNGSRPYDRRREDGEFPPTNRRDRSGSQRDSYGRLVDADAFGQRRYDDRGDDRFDSDDRNLDRGNFSDRGVTGSGPARSNNGVQSASDRFSEDLKRDPIDPSNAYSTAGVVGQGISYTTTPLVNGILLVSGIINCYLFIWLRNIRVRYRDLVASKRVVESAAV